MKACPSTLRLAAFALLTLSLARPAGAGLIQGTINPNPEDVLCDNQVIGSLSIANYYGWMSNANTPPGYTPRNPYTDVGYTDPMTPNRDGALMQAIFTPNANACPMNYQWVQAITAGVGTIGTPPYLDPFNRDDNLPFYWTTPEANTNGVGKANGVAGSQFIDIPSQSNANTGNSITFEAALVSYSGMQVHWLAGFTWGYSINAMGNTVLTNFAYTNGISNTMTNLITGWASTPNSPYTPVMGQKPDGWTVTNDCLCVPEPGTLLLSIIGMGTLALHQLCRARRASRLAA